MASLTSSFVSSLPHRLPLSYIGRARASKNGLSRMNPRCSSLEDSKKSARSPYDNIPDLNQLYLQELRRARMEQGLSDSVSEISSSILRKDGVRAPKRTTGNTEILDEAAAKVARERSLLAFRRLRAKLLGDTAFLGTLQCCAAWAMGSTNTAASVALGVAASMAYVILLSRGVERTTRAGDPLAPARKAILALVVVGAARHRESFQVIPVLLGFFSYKLATLLPLVTGEAFDESF